MTNAYQNNYSGHLNVFWVFFLSLENILTYKFVLEVLPDLGISESLSEIKNIIAYSLVLKLCLENSEF